MALKAHNTSSPINDDEFDLMASEFHLILHLRQGNSSRRPGRHRAHSNSYTLASPFGTSIRLRHSCFSGSPPEHAQRTRLRTGGLPLAWNFRRHWLPRIYFHARPYQETIVTEKQELVANDIWAGTRNSSVSPNRYGCFHVPLTTVWPGSVSPPCGGRSTGNAVDPSCHVGLVRKSRFQSDLTKALRTSCHTQPRRACAHLGTKC